MININKVFCKDNVNYLKKVGRQASKHASR